MLVVDSQELQPRTRTLNSNCSSVNGSTLALRTKLFFFAAEHFTTNSTPSALTSALLAPAAMQTSRSLSGVRLAAQRAAARSERAVAAFAATAKKPAPKKAAEPTGDTELCVRNG